MFSITYDRDMTATRDRMVETVGAYPHTYIDLEGNADGNQFHHVWAVAGEALEVTETSPGEYVMVAGELGIDGFTPGPIGYVATSDTLPDMATSWLQAMLILLSID